MLSHLDTQLSHLPSPGPNFITMPSQDLIEAEAIVAGY